MTVTLLHNTPLYIAAKAIRKCWASEDKSDTIVDEDCYVEIGDSGNEEDISIFTTRIGAKDKALIERVGNKNKHGSTLEHLNYTFDIDGISRALLQELARHRHASLSVKSSRYTLGKLKTEATFIGSKTDERDMTSVAYDYVRAENYIVLTGSNNSGAQRVDRYSVDALENLRKLIEANTSNDKAKYCLPESYKTSLTYTINARSLQNLLGLRTAPSALAEFRKLAQAMYNNLPEEHKYLFTDSVYKEPTCED